MQMLELLSERLSLASFEELHVTLFSILHATGPSKSDPSAPTPHEIPSVVNQTKLSFLIGCPLEPTPISAVAPSIQYAQQFAAPVLTVTLSAAKHWISSSLTEPYTRVVASSSSPSLVTVMDPIFSPIDLNLG